MAVGCNAPQEKADCTENRPRRGGKMPAGAAPRPQDGLASPSFSISAFSRKNVSCANRAYSAEPM